MDAQNNAPEGDKAIQAETGDRRRNREPAQEAELYNDLSSKLKRLPTPLYENGILVYPDFAWKAHKTNVDDRAWLLDDNATKYANELLEAVYERLPFPNEELDDDQFQAIEPKTDPNVHCYQLSRSLFEDSTDGPLFTRKDSRAVWNAIFDLCKTDQARSHKILVTGNPGIGKSRGLKYLLKLLLQDGQVVLLHTRMRSAAQIFVPTSTRIDKNDGKVVPVYQVWLCYCFKASGCPVLTNVNNYYLVDPSETRKDPTVVAAKTILAASPNLGHYKGFVKHPHTRLYLPLWNNSEVTAMFKKLKQLNYHETKNVSDDDFCQRLYLNGPVPRALFSNQSEMQDNLTTAIAEITFETLTNVLDATSLTIEVNQSRTKSALPSNIFGYVVKDESKMDPMQRYDTYSVVFVSNHARNTLYAKYWDRMHAYLSPSSVWINKYPAMTDAFIEQLAISMIATGGLFKFVSTSQSQQANNESTARYVQGFTSVVRTSDKPGKELEFLKQCKNISPNNSNQLLVPSSPNQPVVDAMSAPNVGYQVTISDKHKINVCQLLEMMSVLQFSPSNPLKIFIVKPDAQERNEMTFSVIASTKSICEKLEKMLGDNHSQDTKQSITNVLASIKQAKTDNAKKALIRQFAQTLVVQEHMIPDFSIHAFSHEELLKTWKLAVQGWPATTATNT